MAANKSGDWGWIFVLLLFGGILLARKDSPQQSGSSKDPNPLGPKNRAPNDAPDATDIK